MTAWCTDPEAGALAGDVGCATASLCLLSEFPGGRLEGDVHIEVSLISFADFSEAFGAEALAELYEPLEAPVTSCAPALCGPEECTADDAWVNPRVATYEKILKTKDTDLTAEVKKLLGLAKSE